MRIPLPNIVGDRFEGPISVPGLTLKILWFSDPRYEPGFTVQEHVHGCYELYLLVDGTAMYTVGESFFEVAPGDLCLAKPGELHSIRGIGDESWRVFHAGVDDMDPPELLNTFAGTNIRCLRNRSNLLPSFIRMLDEARRPKFASPRAIQLLMAAWLIEVGSELRSPDSLQMPEGFSEAVYHARDYIERNARHGLSVSDIAHHVGYSESHLAHVFSKETGTAIYRYLLQVVMCRAMRLIEEGKLNITEISDLLNFPCVSNFSISFKRYFGMSPSSMRTKSKAGHTRDH